MSLILTQVYEENGSLLFLVVLLVISVEIQTEECGTSKKGLHKLMEKIQQINKIN